MKRSDRPLSAVQLCSVPATSIERSTINRVPVAFSGPIGIDPAPSSVWITARSPNFASTQLTATEPLDTHVEQFCCTRDHRSVHSLLWPARLTTRWAESQPAGRVAHKRTHNHPRSALRPTRTTRPEDRTSHPIRTSGFDSCGPGCVRAKRRRSDSWPGREARRQSRHR